MRTRLHEAAQSGRLAGVKRCLDQGIDLNVKDDQGRSPLHYAAQEGHLQVAALLLARGAAPNLADQYNQVPLHLAASGPVGSRTAGPQASIDADKSGP
jgi:ankyrin repeat protein